MDRMLFSQSSNVGSWYLCISNDSTGIVRQVGNKFYYFLNSENLLKKYLRPGIEILEVYFFCNSHFASIKDFCSCGIGKTSQKGSL